MATGAVAAQDSATKLVEVEEIKVTGTRLAASSIIRLSGLKVGMQVNDLTVNAACHQVTATGLVKLIDYAYDVYPDKPGVVLNLSVVDELPLFAARIEPAAEAEDLWQSLQAVDPMFTRELPRTEKALRYYATMLERVLKSKGRAGEYAAPSVVGDKDGKPRDIVFTIRKYKEK